MSLYKQLQAARVAAGTNFVEEANPYAGHSFESELNDIDAITSIMEIGMEGTDVYSEIELAPIMAAYENEEGRVDFGLESAPVEFGVEAIGEKIKRAGYRASGLAKKISAVIVAFFKRIVNILTNKNLIIKKYGKALEKANDRLATKTFKKADDKVSIRDYAKLPALVKLATEHTADSIDGKISGVEKATSITAFFNTTSISLLSLCKAGVSKPKEVSPESVQKIIDDKVIQKAFDNIIKENEVGKASDITLAAAKSRVTSTINSIKSYLEEDVKIQAGLRKLVKAVETKRSELMEEKSNQEANNVDEMNIVINKLGTVVAFGQAGYTKLFKHTTGCLSNLLTDASKVLAA